MHSFLWNIWDKSTIIYLSKSLIENSDIKSCEKKKKISISRISAYLYIDAKKLINYVSRESKNNKPLFHLVDDVTLGYTFIIWFIARFNINIYIYVIK